MTEIERQQIIALVKSSDTGYRVYGTYCCGIVCSKGSEILGKCPEKVTVLLSANILKNTQWGVGLTRNRYDRIAYRSGVGRVNRQVRISVGSIERLYTRCGGARKTVYRREAHSHSTEEGIEEKLYIEVRCEAGKISLPPSLPADTTLYMWHATKRCY